MTAAPDLRADCTRCAALCCMAPAFDESPSFAFDKPAVAPCPNLNDAGRCRIHDNLTQSGFSGCAAYDCLGAGQRVTQDIFEGHSWLAEPDLKDRMTQAFMVMRRIHELLAMLTAAKALPLDAKEREALLDLFEELSPAPGWNEDGLSRAPIEDLTARTNGFLRSLQRHVGAAAAERSPDV